MSIEIVPFVDLGLGNSSYLVGLPDRRAMVIDPLRSHSRYLRQSEQRGWNVIAAVESHLHADFISGGRELQAGGSTLYAPTGSRLAFDHHAMEPGAEVDLGGLTLAALPTPGHTPEHLSYLLSDGEQPLALFSGGSLLVGSVARTDLISSEQTEDLTRSMYRSLRAVLAPLPDELAVYPTHGAGSFCTVGVTTERVTTLGAERAHNPYLQIDDEDEFVKLLLGGLGSYPTYYRHLRERNRQGPRVYGETPPALKELTVEDCDRIRGEGAAVVDVRSVAAWASGHVPSSLSIRFRDSFASWLGWLVDIDAPLIFVTEPGQDRAALAARCLDIGYESLAGELAGGIEAWSAAGRPVSSTPTASIGEHDGGHLVDVRQASEWRAGHIPGVVHAELGSLQAASLPHGPVAIHCGQGERAATAASLLEQAGRSNVTILSGGPDDWVKTTNGLLEVG
ncbi:MAG: MBL fold metallo-hydrolase [Acidimicrobiia bacterium]